MGIVYSALKEEDEIRLLRLEPGSGSQPLRASIIHARLGESPSYDALSYMWGKDEPSRTQVNHLLYFNDGRRFGLRENLYNALRYLRSKDHVRTLWVDAICINQADDSERGHQVAQMGLIYSQATTVRIWLGLPDDASNNAFDILEDPQVIFQLRQSPPRLLDWLDIAELCRRDYWERLWIIQEVVLAARIEIHCGRRALCWEKFSKAVLAFEEDSQILQRLGTDNAVASWRGIVDSPALKICRQRKANNETGPITESSSLLSLFWIHQDAKCMDVRDKIFGLHSFAPACCRSYIPVDYTASAISLCGRLLAHDIYHHPRRRHNTGMEDALIESLDLHELIIGGALKQNGSINPFEIGSLVQQQCNIGNQREAVDSFPESSFTVLGHYCGHINFVSPPLKSIFEGEEGLRVPDSFVHSIKVLKLGLQDYGNPAFTKSVTKSLALVWRSQDFAQDVTISYASQGYPTLDSYDNYAAQCLSTLIKFLSEFLRTSEFLREETIYEDCVMFMSGSGTSSWLGFAPANTKTGDMIYTFKDTDIIAVVREAAGQLRIVGQGSRLNNPDAAKIPPLVSTGEVSRISFNIPLLQAFSGKLIRRCELPAYRAVMNVQPEIPKMHKPQIPATLSIRSKEKLKEAPQSITRSNNASISIKLSKSEHLLSPPKYSEPNKHLYSCPRCKETFINARDNIIHASSWSHEQCDYCKRWTSWESKTSSRTSTTAFCTQCRIDNPDCWVRNALDPILEEDPQQSSSRPETEETISSTQNNATFTTYERLSRAYHNISEKRVQSIPCLREELQILSRLMEFFEAVSR